MNKQAQFAKLAGSLATIINSDPFLNADQKSRLDAEISAVNQAVQAGITKGIEMRLCMIRNSMLEWRREALFA